MLALGLATGGFCLCVSAFILSAMNLLEQRRARKEKQARYLSRLNETLKKSEDWETPVFKPEAVSFTPCAVHKDEPAKEEKKKTAPRFHPLLRERDAKQLQRAMVELADGKVEPFSRVVKVNRSSLTQYMNGPWPMSIRRHNYVKIKQFLQDYCSASKETVPTAPLFTPTQQQ